MAKSKYDRIIKDVDKALKPYKKDAKKYTKKFSKQADKAVSNAAKNFKKSDKQRLVLLSLGTFVVVGFLSKACCLGRCRRDCC